MNIIKYPLSTNGIQWFGTAMNVEIKDLYRRYSINKYKKGTQWNILF